MCPVTEGAVEQAVEDLQCCGDGCSKIPNIPGQEFCDSCRNESDEDA